MLNGVCGGLQVGTVTCWPSLLSMAATWDLKIMRDFSEALGAEFAGKGAQQWSYWGDTNHEGAAVGCCAL